jgi:hypothetical protein
MAFTVEATAAPSPPFLDQEFDRELRMKCPSTAVLAVVCIISVVACTIRQERTVQQPAPAATVVTPAPAGTVVYTQPAPATTTVYTNR